MSTGVLSRQEEDRGLLTKDGFDGHIVKPVDDEELTRLLGSPATRLTRAIEAPSRQIH